MLTVQKISNLKQFAALSTEWDTLLEQSAANTIALTHDWLLTWWEVFGTGRELCVLTVRDGNALIGVAPLLKRRVSSLGVPMRRLEFLASGEDSTDEICSPYLDFILQNGREADALKAIFRFLHEEETAWDEIVLTELLDSSPSLSVITTEAEAAELKCEIVESGEAVYLPLSTDWDTIMEQVSRKMRHNTKQELKAFEKSGGEFSIAQSGAEFEAHFAGLVELHQTSWIARGQPGVFASAPFSRFHRKLRERLLPKGQIRVPAVHIEGEIVAALYLFYYNGKVFFYQSGFKVRPPLHSPGNLVRSLAIQHAIRDGYSEWDFLQAENDSYKYRWNPGARRIVRARLAKPHPKETTLMVAQHVRDTLRAAKRTLRRSPNASP